MENDNEINQEEIKKIEDDMLELYTRNQNLENEDKINNVVYYNKIIFNNENLHISYALLDLYVVSFNLDENKEKQKLVLYQYGNEIGIINENGIIEFNESYLNEIKEYSIEIYNFIKNENGKIVDIEKMYNESNEKDKPNINEKNINRYEMNAEELEQKENLRKDQLLDDEKVQEEENEEDNNVEKISKKYGISKNEISSCSEIKPSEKITDTKGFEDIIGIKGKYTKIFVVNSNSQSNSKFSFWGMNKDGTVEQIDGLEERFGVNTGKKIVSINRDGSEVKQEQTSALFTMPNNKEGFSVTIGQYGIVETTYIRKSPDENQFIGTKINSSTQKPTTRQVKEFMNSARNNDYELEEMREKAVLETNSTAKTNIENIDNIYGNDVAIDIDQIITVNGEDTTLRKEAEKINISPYDYRKMIERIEDATTEEKILRIRIEKQLETEKEMAEDRDRGTQLDEYFNNHIEQ